MTESPFEMVGTVEAEVCVDGVCAVPSVVAESEES
jgi:hypothetical protein